MSFFHSVEMRERWAYRRQKYGAQMISRATKVSDKSAADRKRSLIIKDTPTGGLNHKITSEEKI